MSSAGQNVFLHYHVSVLQPCLPRPRAILIPVPYPRNQIQLHQVVLKASKFCRQFLHSDEFERHETYLTFLVEQVVESFEASNLSWSTILGYSSCQTSFLLFMTNIDWDIMNSPPCSTLAVAVVHTVIYNPKWWCSRTI